jgi:hypothetical protein
MRNDTGQMKHDLDVLPGGMKHLEHRLIRHQVEERLQVDALGQRIDDDGFVGACHLHDAEQRVIGRLPQEFGIDGDDGEFGEPAANVREFRGRRDQLVHAQSMTFPALPICPPWRPRRARDRKDGPKGSAGILPSCAQRFPKLVWRVPKRASETGAHSNAFCRKR